MKSIVSPKVLGVWLLAALCSVGLAACSINVGLKKKPVAVHDAGLDPERTPIYHHGPWTVARASMHNHTVYSDGAHTPEDVLKLARMQGMAILAYNDHRENKVCVDQAGLVCAEIGGVERVGYQAYFDHLRQIQAAAADLGVIVLKGLEFIPYFYNYGKPPNLVVDGFQHHFTVYGLEDPEVLAAAPVAHNLKLKPGPISDEKPWAEFVDYIAAAGGIVHAVHVEDGADMWIGPLHGACPPPIQNIYLLKNLTGFSVLPSGWHEKVGGPGGLWDVALAEYLLGMREKPLWSMGDADFHDGGSLAYATTLFYLREFVEEDIYRCLRDGRMVSLQGEAFQDVFVAEWWVSSGGAPKDLVMLGEEVALSSAPRVRFQLSRDLPDVHTRLIKNGVVIHERDGGAIDYVDRDWAASRAPAYYRVEVIGPVVDRPLYAGATTPASELFVNPIFVRPGG